jgi:fatty-acyl-CoA synthase
MKEVTIVYGLTESSPGMTQSDVTDSLEVRCGTVGRPMPGVGVRVVDPATGADLPPGAPGEVLCRGYNVMKGYYNMPEATREAVSPEGWLHSGDLGIMDERGYLRITGRIKDMIIRGGENIYPREIEEYLMGMEGVRDVQVVGVPSHKYGEEVGAFIIPKEGWESMTVEDVRDFCRGKIAWHKIPRYVSTLKEFPMTGSAKIQKYKLREMAAELFPEPSKNRKGAAQEE